MENCNRTALAWISICYCGVGCGWYSNVRHFSCSIDNIKYLYILFAFIENVAQFRVFTWCGTSHLSQPNYAATNRSNFIHFSEEEKDFIPLSCLTYLKMGIWGYCMKLTYGNVLFQNVISYWHCTKLLKCMCVCVCDSLKKPFMHFHFLTRVSSFIHVLPLLQQLVSIDSFRILFNYRYVWLMVILYSMVYTNTWWNWIERHCVYKRMTVEIK